jgi:hypothetical protein
MRRVAAFEQQRDDLARSPVEYVLRVGVQPRVRVHDQERAVLVKRDLSARRPQRRGQ